MIRNCACHIDDGEPAWLTPFFAGNWGLRDVASRSGGDPNEAPHYPGDQFILIESRKKVIDPVSKKNQMINRFDRVHSVDLVKWTILSFINRRLQFISVRLETRCVARNQSILNLLLKVFLSLVSQFPLRSGYIEAVQRRDATPGLQRSFLCLSLVGTPSFTHRRRSSENQLTPSAAPGPSPELRSQLHTLLVPPELSCSTTQALQNLSCQNAVSVSGKSSDSASNSHVIMYSIPFPFSCLF